MVQELVLRIVYLSNVGVRLAEASAYADHYHGNHQQEERGRSYLF